MKTIFIPDARSKNPYQINLSNSLLKSGVIVYFDEGAVIRSIIKYWPDVVHIHWPDIFMIANGKYATIAKSMRFICGILVLKTFGTKIVWTVHNITDHEGKYKSIELFFNKILARICDKLIVHCNSAKVDVVKLYGIDSSLVTIIPHGHYIGTYENRMTQSQARDKLKIDNEQTVFLYFGQIRSYKGVLDLVNTFKRLDCQQVRLLIVGKPLNDEIGSELSKWCKDDYRIKTILRFVPDEDIQIYLNAADIIILPYKDVLTSGAVILSMSFSKPIIAPAVKCITDILDNEGSFLYSEKDELFEVMKRTLRTDRKCLIHMGEHNLKLAERYGWEDVAENTYKIYQSILQ